MLCVEDESCDWRTLAYAFGTLFAQGPAHWADETHDGRDDRLVGLVVHELRTPVAIIKAYAELLEAQVTSRSKHTTTLNAEREIMAHILTQADLMADWVDAMLELQRLQVGELPLELTRVDLVHLAWLVAQEFQQTTCRHQLRVVASGSPPPPVLADPCRLRQLLSNLLENAVKYAAGGTILIRLGTQSDSGKAIVAVHDEGPGLDTGQLDRIFAPFEQAERPSAGLGLGLYLAREIARLHGGDLWAESRGRMNGSTFVLALPLAA
jgi:signal transduction histidine kinase